MIRSYGYDVECFPNMFSIIFVDMSDYLQKFKDCVDNDGKPVPMSEKLSVAEIKSRLDSVKSHTFYISDTDDSQLLELVAFINNMQPKYETHYSDDGVVYEVPVRYDLFGFNNEGYDDYMIKAFLMYYNRFDNTKYLCKKLKEINDKIINLQSDKELFYKDNEIKLISKYKLPYATVDVQQVFGLHSASVSTDKETGERQKFGKSLKQTSINLKWYNLLDFKLSPITDEEMRLYYAEIDMYKNCTLEQLNKLIINDFDRYIMPDDIKPMLAYNINDVFIVCELCRLKPDEIKLRYSITNAFKVNVLCAARAKIANLLTIKFYSDMSGLHRDSFINGRTERSRISFDKIIFPHIKFKTPQLQYLLNYMKGVHIYHTSSTNKTIPMKDLTDYLRVSDKEGIFKAELDFYGTTYSIATGGIHSVDPPRVLKSNDKYIIRHHDYTSYYPSLMIEYEIAPKHLHKKSFCNMISFIKDTRVKAKHATDDIQVIINVPNNITAEALKIVINAIYGKLGSDVFFLYDRLAQMQVTINGQLMTMTLIEELELNGIHVLSANTDGIIIKLPRDKVDIYDKIVEDWNKRNKMSADFEDYQILVSRDVNNYFDIQYDSKKNKEIIEYKGTFNPKQYLKDLTKGFNMPIVAIAVYNYFRYNKPVMETLREHKDILDFCKTQNIGKQFEVVYDYLDENGIKHSVKSQRHTRYYASTKGFVIQKEHLVTKKREVLVSGLPVILLNTLDDIPIEERNINYKYYYDEAYKIINPIMLRVAPKQKGDKRKGTVSGKVLLKKYNQQYLTLFDEDE